jgi:uncharacterized protein YecE (DUF72 family)
LAEVTPPGFRFAVIIQHKIIREIHFGSLLSLSFFLQSILPLQESAKLGCLVAQVPRFPRSLWRHGELLILLERLRQGFAGLPLVVEYPHDEWLPEAAFQFLRDQGMGLVFVDEPHSPIPTRKGASVTSHLGYMRFQGRSHGDRLESSCEKAHGGYLYSVEDFKEWLPRIMLWRNQTEDLYLFVKGICPEKAVLDAWKLKILLEDALDDLGGPRTMPARQCSAGTTR